MSAYYHTDVSEFRTGMRVELHPSHDAWMRGDRYATVTRVGNSVVFVRSDKSGRVRWFHPQSLAILEG